MPSITPRRALASTAIAVILFLTLEWLPWMIQDVMAPGGTGHEQWTFWFQTVSGNWAPTDKPPVNRWAYAFSAVLAVLLNNALLVTAIILVWRTIAEWRRRMQLDQLLVAQEQATKLALGRAFPGQGEKIRAAVTEGRERLFNEIATVFGNEEAYRIKSRLKDEV